MTVADLMVKQPASVLGSDTVGAAIDLICEHRLQGVPVVDQHRRLLGLVTPVALLRQPLYRPVAEAMASVEPATPDLPAVRAQALLTRQRVEVLPVVVEGRLVGLLSLTAVLEATGQQRDPLTGLPWSSALRTWAGAALNGGAEVAIIFVDLDNFGLVNKALGHVVGDDLLQAVACLLSSVVDAPTDMLCRYGGDEFAIATTRRKGEVKALADRIRDAVSLPMEIDGVVRRVTASVGFAGGQRAETRASTHITATVEDLITRASRGSTLAKGREKRAAGAWGGDASRADGAVRPRVDARCHLLDVVLAGEAPRCTARVVLALGNRTAAGTVSGDPRARGVPFLVAEATAQAVALFVGDAYPMAVEDVTEIAGTHGTLVVVVLGTTAGMPERLVGAARGADLPHAVARATLDAINRRLARIIGSVLRRESILSELLPDTSRA